MVTEVVSPAAKTLSQAIKELPAARAAPANAMNCRRPIACLSQMLHMMIPAAAENCSGVGSILAYQTDRAQLSPQEKLRPAPAPACGSGRRGSRNCGTG